MKLELDDFIAETKRLHRRSVKRTRLMLRLRPHSAAAQRRRIFVLKCTDGERSFTTHVESTDALKRVEALVNDFVSDCVKDSASVANHSPAAATAGSGQKASDGAAAAPAAPAARAGDSKHSNNTGKQSKGQGQGGGKAGGKKGKR